MTDSTISQKVDQRIARFVDLAPIEAQKSHPVPQEVADIVWSRKLLPVITLGEEVATPFGPVAPIKGAAGLTMTYAVCPPNTGPSLHSHRQTYETFTVMQGRFEFAVGDDGACRRVLERFDVISVPPGMARAFRNISDEEGILQVVISGGVHDMNDIYFPDGTRRLIEEHSPDHLAYFEKMGLKFSAE